MTTDAGPVTGNVEIERSTDPRDGNTKDPYAIGHRGCLDVEPENTVRAALAAAPHVDAIEVDVRRCATGEIVVFHDPTLTRICGVDKQVADCSLAELRTHGVAGTNERIPTLRELLAGVPKTVDVNVEVKTTGLATDVADMLRSVENDGFVSSFSARALAEFREVAPDIDRGLLYTRSWRRAIAAAERLDCALVHPYAEVVDVEHVRAATAAGYRVNVWGVADRETYRRLVDVGVCGVIVDDYRIATAERSDSP